MDRLNEFEQRIRSFSDHSSSSSSLSVYHQSNHLHTHHHHHHHHHNHHYYYLRKQFGCFVSISIVLSALIQSIQMSIIIDTINRDTVSNETSKSIAKNFVANNISINSNETSETSNIIVTSTPSIRIDDIMWKHNLNNNNQTNSTTTTTTTSSSQNKVENFRTKNEPFIFINGRSVSASNISSMLSSISFSTIRSSIDHQITQQLNPQSNHHRINNNNHSNANDSSLSSQPDSPDQCVDGKTWWNSRTGHCQPCLTQCPSGVVISRACNRTHDLECICPKGSYMSIVDGQCKQCSECPSGYGVWRTCRWSRNTVCRQCQPGTYSGVSVGTLGCIPCSKCGRNQEMISACDGNHDTICIDRSMLADSFLNSIDEDEESIGEDEDNDVNIFDSNGMKFTGDVSNFLGSNRALLNEVQSSASSLSNPDRLIYSNGHGLPFYIAMLVVVAFTFFIYALIQFRCNNDSFVESQNHHHFHRSMYRQNNTNSSTIHRDDSNRFSNANFNHRKLNLSTSIGLETDKEIPKSINTLDQLYRNFETIPNHSYKMPSFENHNSSSADYFINTNSLCEIDPSMLPQDSNPVWIDGFGQKISKSKQKFRPTKFKSEKKLYKKQSRNKAYYQLLLGPSLMNSNKNVSHRKSIANDTTTIIQSVPLISDDVQHLTIEIRQALENLLGKNSECWRQLAKELGYDQQDIVKFEEKATTISNGHSMVDTFKAIRLLLMDWSSQMTTSSNEWSKISTTNNEESNDRSVSSDPPSLASLTKALIRIGRVDCARVVVRQNHHQNQLIFPMEKQQRDLTSSNQSAIKK